MYKYTVIEQELYKKSFKKLSKTYRNIDLDIKEFLHSINTKEDLGIELKSNVFKVRIKNSDKNRGKSAGYRLISYLTIIENELHLLYIYDKSKLVNVTEKEVDELVAKQVEED
jgi:mRNA-degrading endonuclease RelE of RelBE toxin-antitoxin system